MYLSRSPGAADPTSGRRFDAGTDRLGITVSPIRLARVCAMGERRDGTIYLSQVRQRGAPKDAVGPCLVIEEQTDGR
jgi:hypothetical protein